MPLTACQPFLDRVNRQLHLEALEMTGPEHPNGFMTGITKGVNLESAAGNATSLSGKF
jgi:hypothetical protein